MQNAETMTLEAIGKDPWAAVQLPLPLDVNRELLTAARSAPQRCEGEAWRIVRTHDREDADSVGYAAEMQFMAGQAGGRVGEIEDRLAALAAPARPRVASSPRALRVGYGIMENSRLAERGRGGGQPESRVAAIGSDLRVMLRGSL